MSADLENLLTIAETYIKKDRQNFEIDTAAAYIPSLIESSIKEKEFYEWFCPLWQACEYVYTDSKDDKWNTYLVVPFLEALLQDWETRPTLRAMCVSYMLTSLNIPESSQAIALRMLILFATTTKNKEKDLCANEQFVSWILSFMKDHIESMFNIEMRRNLFIQVSIEFFSNVQSFNISSLKSLLLFFSNKNVKDFVQKLSGGDFQEKTPQYEDAFKSEEIFSQLRSTAMQIAISALKYPRTNNKNQLLDESLFIFEIILSTEVIRTFLDQDTKNLLEIFVNGTYSDYINFFEQHPDFINKYGLDKEVLLDKMQILSFLSIANGKQELSYDDISKPLRLNPIQMRKLIYKLNSSNIASTMIDAVNEKICIYFCQPRKFSTNIWEDMSKRLKEASDSLNAAITQP